ncbi:MAG: 2-amino-4-hydroxy-6-hydroxymethyldihydropteridine diphosphokinase [Gemmatimonadales bacterium]|jgi:2-amino-4-hydroxy-6-hydroxymethyldihydropteridine diphosphokinase
MNGVEHRVAVGLGSNLGDRLAHLRAGLLYLRRVVDEIRVSDVYETEPVGYSDQGPFLNACVIGATRLTPRQLLDELKHAERLAGRTGGGPRNGPRVLDLDLLLYGTRSVHEPDLIVPHPRLRQRAFVLVPLRDIAADWRVPGEEEQPGPTVAELAAAVGAGGVTRTSMQLGEAG